MDNWDIIIKPKSKWYEIDFKSLIEYKDLIALFVRRNFVVQYKQTLLGPLWVLITPLLNSIVFTFVFGKFAGLSTDGMPQMLFYISGTVLWSLVSVCVTRISNTFVLNLPIYGKVYFPRLVIPISEAISAMFNFLIQFAVVVVLTLYYALFTNSGVIISLKWLLIPVLMLQCMILATGVGLMVAALTAKYRDLTYVMGFFVQLWMYASPVIYPLSSSGGLMRTVLLINPMGPLLENYRYCLFGGVTFYFGSWVVSVAVSILILFLGTVLFEKTARHAVDTL